MIEPVQASSDADASRAARLQFVLEDYRTMQQSLSRLDASMVSMRNWMVVTVIAYYGLVVRLTDTATGGPTHAAPHMYLLPPLILWLLSYVFTTYERGNCRALVEIIMLIERAHLIQNEGEFRSFTDSYVPVNARLKGLKWWKRIPAFYLPALTDVPVIAWHVLLLLFILISGYAMYPSLLCLAQCLWEYIGAGTVLGASMLLSCVGRRKWMRSPLEELRAARSLTTTSGR